jgi:hypothetical protein
MVMGFAILLIVHGLIHLLGTAKAFGWAELPQLAQPISAFLGLLWLLSALLVLVAAVGLFIWPRTWWAIGAAALVLSMVVIASSWTDAKFGALANASCWWAWVHNFRVRMHGASAAVGTDGGCRSLPSSTTLSIRRRACST